MYFAAVALLDAKPAYKVDISAVEADWRGVRVLAVFPQLFAMVDLVGGTAVLEVDLVKAPLPLGGRMVQAQGLAVGTQVAVM
jgi:hypothetical protein